MPRAERRASPFGAYCLGAKKTNHRYFGVHRNHGAFCHETSVFDLLAISCIPTPREPDEHFGLAARLEDVSDRGQINVAERAFERTRTLFTTISGS